MSAVLTNHVDTLRFFGIDFISLLAADAECRWYWVTLNLALIYCIAQFTALFPHSIPLFTSDCVIYFPLKQRTKLSKSTFCKGESLRFNFIETLFKSKCPLDLRLSPLAHSAIKTKTWQNGWNIVFEREFEYFALFYRASVVAKGIRLLAWFVLPWPERPFEFPCAKACSLNFLKRSLIVSWGPHKQATCLIFVQFPFNSSDTDCQGCYKIWTESLQNVSFHIYGLFSGQVLG